MAAMMTRRYSGVQRTCIEDDVKVHWLALAHLMKKLGLSEAIRANEQTNVSLADGEIFMLRVVHSEALCIHDCMNRRTVHTDFASVLTP